MKIWTKFGGTVLIILVLDTVLIFAPPFAPVPRQSAESSSQNSGQVGSNSRSNKQPAPPLIARNGVVQAESQTKHGEEKTGHDKQQQITVVSLPEVSVASDYKGWVKRLYDWGPWTFSGLVAVFSGFQIWLLMLTLKRVSRQADVANRQAKIMVRQVAEMRKVSEIENKTLILQYRPRIIVRHARVIAFSKEIGEGVFSEPVRCRVAFQIVNIGGSPAHVVDGNIYLLSARPGEPGEEIEFKESTNMGIGHRTLQPGEWESLEFGLDTRIPNDARWVEFYKGASSHTIFLLGTIWYRDDLDIPRATGIHRKYDPATKRFEPKKDSEDEYSD